MMATGAKRGVSAAHPFIGFAVASTALAYLILCPPAAASALVTASPVKAGSIPVHDGQFESDGKPVEDFYCVPAGTDTHPAVILLHGAVPRGAQNAAFAGMCRGLAAAGYYAMFVEYYSQAGPAKPGDPPVSGRGFTAWVNGNFPVWMREIVSGISALGHNPAVARGRIAVIGYSLGGFLAVAAGATEGGRLAAVAEYYGGMPVGYARLAANMPPTLIMHGADDRVVPVSYAYKLNAILTHRGRPHEMKIYPGVGHGFGVVTHGKSWQTMLGFLRRYLGR
jgi:carboxymethylenebutenolidase